MSVLDRRVRASEASARAAESKRLQRIAAHLRELGGGNHQARNNQVISGLACPTTAPLRAKPNQWFSRRVSHELPPLKVFWPHQYGLGDSRRHWPLA